MSVEFTSAFMRLQESHGTFSWKPLTLEDRSKVIGMWEAMGDFSLELEKEGIKAAPGLPMYNAAGMGFNLKEGDISSPAYIFRSVDYPVTCAGSVVYTDYGFNDPDLKSLARQMKKWCRFEDSGFDVSLHLENATAPFYPDPDCKYMYRVELELADIEPVTELSPEYLRKVLELLSRSLRFVRRYIKMEAYLDEKQPSFATPQDALDEFWYENELYSWGDCIVHQESGGDCGNLKVYEIEKGNLLISVDGMYGRWLILAVSDPGGVVRMYDAVECQGEPGELFGEFFSLTGSMLTRELIDRNAALINYIVSNVYGLKHYERMSDEEYKEILNDRISEERFRREQELKEWLHKLFGSTL